MVQHQGAHAHTHSGKQQYEEQVHGVAQQAVIAAQHAEEPAALKQRVGDFTTEDDSAGLTARLPHAQGQQEAHDAHDVVGQHDGALGAVTHTPAHVEEEVAEADGQGPGLEGGVLCAWVLEKFRGEAGGGG